ncbi:serine/arginine repetitive matrix protein 2-like isoform X1 [Schistocerca cancellata]|uniref:serine/arginine repetitive matrix protein 2-like isoform X1 n=1 Tax=Schistocerca cancellata TaxID=274614 RepID=UPI002117E13D|nr:serine/arginine repetitive matrix protein 2-like isoform X1 [Schistocerca cancellata]
MEKREQRARRDRRRDGKRNTFQNDQGKETVKPQQASVEEKKIDSQNVEVSNKKNTSEEKGKTIEDDPLRFANLKRETDEIAALKAKKPLKRQIFSNWSKYEEPLPNQDESRAVDFETLLHAPQSGGFRFKSEQQWDTGSYGRFGEIFTPDAELLAGGLTSLPFYKRLNVDKTLFSEDEIQRMDRCAKENYRAYEKLSKSKPKPKVAATDLFQIDQAEKYSVVDQVNEQTVELSTNTSKPVFSVEESPERTPAELTLSAHPASSNARPNDNSRESRVPTARVPEGPVQDFHFGKPPPSSLSAAENLHSQTPDREHTPLRDSGRDVTSPEFHFERAPPPSYTSGTLKSPFQSRESTPAKEAAPATVVRKPPTSSFGAAENLHSQTPDRMHTPPRDSGRCAVSPEFHFERAPPPSYASGNMKSPFQSRESTPAKETAPLTVSRGSGNLQAPVSRAVSDGWVTGQEGTPEPTAPAPPVRERETVRDDRPGAAKFASTVGTPSEDVSLRGGASVGEHDDDSALRETSPVRKAMYDHPQITPSASRETKHTLDKIPSEMETVGREEIPREPVLQRNGADVREDLTHQKSPHERDIVSEQKLEDNGQICTENDSYSKKGGKSDIKKPEGQQRGGGRHGRRKKGQNASARGGEQLRGESGDVAGPEVGSSVHTTAKADVQEEARHEEPRPAEGAKKKPERPPPPAMLQRDRQQSPLPAPQPSSAPAVVGQPETKATQPLANKPEEPKAQQVKVPATTPDSQAELPQRKTAASAKVEPVLKERNTVGRVDDSGLNFLMSLRGQKVGGVSEVEAAKLAAGATVSRSAIEEDEMKESQKPKPPPVIAAEKKEDLEDWLDSMLDD